MNGELRKGIKEKANIAEFGISDNSCSEENQVNQNLQSWSKNLSVRLAEIYFLTFFFFTIIYQLIISSPKVTSEYYCITELL